MEIYGTNQKSGAASIAACSDRAHHDVGPSEHKTPCQTGFGGDGGLRHGRIARRCCDSYMRYGFNESHTCIRGTHRVFSDKWAPRTQSLKGGRFAVYQN